MTAAPPDTLTTLDEIVDNFSLLEEWDDRYRYVIELGRGLSPLSERDRTDANKVQGCASQVWLATTAHSRGRAGGAGSSVLKAASSPGRLQWRDFFGGLELARHLPVIFRWPQSNPPRNERGC